MDLMDIDDESFDIFQLFLHNPAKYAPVFYGSFLSPDFYATQKGYTGITWHRIDLVKGNIIVDVKEVEKTLKNRLTEFIYNNLQYQEFDCKIFYREIIDKGIGNALMLSLKTLIK